MKPTDPLPPGWYWDDACNSGFYEMRIARMQKGDAPAISDWSPAWAKKRENETVWTVVSQGDFGDGEIRSQTEATFPTAEEATRYIATRAMLNTWPKEPE